MRVLVVHNFYTKPGGEDKVFANEKELLETNGHEVFELTETNQRMDEMGKLELAATTMWSREFYQRMSSEIGRVQPDIVHFHNTFMLISPSGYYAARRHGIPVVQTIHNFRMVCPGSTYYRDNQVCEECLHKIIPYPAITHGCYKGRGTSAVVTAYLATHRLIGTWTRKIDRFIALTEFTRTKMAEAGFPQEKIVVKPNFLTQNMPIGARRGNYMLFIGRLIPEKGVRTLLEAWRELNDIPLKIVGDGPLRQEVEAFVAEHNLTNVSVLGHCQSAETMALLRDAYALVFPSEWYEGFPLTLIEAFASGVPVVTSNLGAMPEIVEENKTGIFFQYGSPNSLTEAVRKAWNSPNEMTRMGKLGRVEYMSKYTAQVNYEALMQIYTDLLPAPSLVPVPSL